MLIWRGVITWTSKVPRLSPNMKGIWAVMLGASEVQVASTSHQQEGGTIGGGSSIEGGVLEEPMLRPPTDPFKHDDPNLVYGIWYMVYDAWHIVHGM